MKFRIFKSIKGLNFQIDCKFRIPNWLQVPIFKPVQVPNFQTDSDLNFQTDYQIFKRVDNDE